MTVAQGSFFACLSAGKKGEYEVLEKWNHLRDNTDDNERAPDIVSENGTLIEVKRCASERARRGADGGGDGGPHVPPDGHALAHGGLPLRPPPA